MAATAIFLLLPTPFPVHLAAISLFAAFVRMAAVGVPLPQIAAAPDYAKSAALLFQQGTGFTTPAWITCNSTIGHFRPLFDTQVAPNVATADNGVIKVIVTRMKT